MLLNSADDQTGAKNRGADFPNNLAPFMAHRASEDHSRRWHLAETERQSASDEKQGIRVMQRSRLASRSYRPCPTFISTGLAFRTAASIYAPRRRCLPVSYSRRAGSLLGHIGRSCYRGEGGWGCSFEGWQCSGSGLRADSGRRCGGSFRANSSRRRSGSWCLRSDALRCC